LHQLARFLERWRQFAPTQCLLCYSVGQRYQSKITATEGHAENYNLVQKTVSHAAVFEPAAPVYLISTHIILKRFLLTPCFFYERGCQGSEERAVET